MLKKRRFLEQDTDELDRNLIASIEKASDAQQKCAEYDSDIVYPGLPDHLSALNNLDSIAAMSSEVLQNLQEKVRELQNTIKDELKDHQALAKLLKLALDSTLVLITLKAELPHKRRKAEPVEPASISNNSEKSRTASPQPRSDSVSAGSTQSGEELTVGRQIAFKLPQSAVDEWIQCEITRIVTPGYRFEVRDPEPDEKGNPGKSYQCRLKDIILLPLKNQVVKPIPVGTIVLARYPETTAFYKATVCSYNSKKRMYNLKFEGEEDRHKETEVEDTLVIRVKK